MEKADFDDFVRRIADALRGGLANSHGRPENVKALRDVAGDDLVFTKADVDHLARISADAAREAIANKPRGWTEDDTDLVGRAIGLGIKESLESRMPSILRAVDEKLAPLIARIDAMERRND